MKEVYSFKTENNANLIYTVVLATIILNKSEIRIKIILGVRLLITQAKAEC